MQTPNADTANRTTEHESDGGAIGHHARSVAGLLIGLVILALGIAIAVLWLANKPKAQRRPPQSTATLVEVTAVQQHDEQVVLRAMGTVVPARSISLAARVSGQITSVEPQFVPGGRFDAGGDILKIDEKDYKLVVLQRLSDLARAQSDLKEELGRRAVARREYELLAQDVEDQDKELLLREPQLAMAKAAVAAAEAALQRARLDEQRTKVTAPFNAMVQSRNVDVGSHVSGGTMLASLVGTDEYWVEISVPLDELRWIGIPGFNAKTGSDARIFCTAAWGKDVFRVGTVTRLMTDLEPEGRMARLLVSVADPLELTSASGERHPLILGSFVRVQIDGRTLPDAVSVPRTAVRDGNRVWVMQDDNTLAIRDVAITWSDSEHIYVTGGLADGDRLIISDLAAPVQGMALRATDMASASPGPRTPDEAMPAQTREDQQ